MSRPRMRYVALIALLTCLLGAALVTGSYDYLGAWVVALRITTGLTSIVVILWTVLFSQTKRPSPPGRPDVQQPTKQEIACAYYDIKHSYKPHVIGMFAKMLKDLPEYLERINEDVTLKEESPQLTIVTHQTYRVASLRADAGEKLEPSDPFLIPAVLVQKGVLLDNFTVTDASGCWLATMSYNQTRGLLGHAIRAIVTSFPEKINGLSSDECKKLREKAIVDLTEAVCYCGPRRKQDPEIRDKIGRLLSSAEQLPVEDKWKQRIRALCEMLVDHYIIVVETIVGTGNYVTLSYNQDIPIGKSTIRHKWRGRFGLRCLTVDIPHHVYAVRTEAYHLQMNAGPMEYIFDHHLEWLTSGDAVKPGELRWGTFIPYVRLHYSSANPAAHLYIRRQSRSQEVTKALQEASTHRDRLKSVIEFREIPPGALGAATIVSLITTVIVCFFALTQIGEEPTLAHPATSLGSDIPALLIALPAVASIVIGSWLDISRLRRASLTTYLGLGASLVLSLASALYFLWDAYKILPGRRILGLPGSITVRTDIGWLVLSGLAITCSLFLCRDLVRTSKYYFQLIRMRVTDHTHGY
jgi:hypothetical protein